MKVVIGEFTYLLGEKVKLYHSNLDMGEYYVEHTSYSYVHPSIPGLSKKKYSLYQKDKYSSSTIENSWKIIMCDNPKIESAYKAYLRDKKLESIDIN